MGEGIRSTGLDYDARHFPLIPPLTPFLARFACPRDMPPAILPHGSNMAQKSLKSLNHLFEHPKWSGNNYGGHHFLALLDPQVTL